MHYWVVCPSEPLLPETLYDGLISHNALFLPFEGFRDKEGAMAVTFVLEGGFGQDTCTSRPRISNTCQYWGLSLQIFSHADQFLSLEALSCFLNHCLQCCLTANVHKKKFSCTLRRWFYRGRRRNWKLIVWSCQSQVQRRVVGWLGRRTNVVGPISNILVFLALNQQYCLYTASLWICWVVFVNNVGLMYVFLKF